MKSNEVNRKGVVIVLAAMMILITIVVAEDVHALTIFQVDFENTTGRTARYLTSNCSGAGLIPQTASPDPLLQQTNTFDNSGATELGYTSSWADTRSVGSCLGTDTDDFVGGIQTSALGITAQSGTGLFAFEDTDGTITLDIQNVSCGASATLRTVSMWYWVANVPYETADSFRIYASADGGLPTDLLNLDEAGLDAETKDAWIQVSQNFSGDLIEVFVEGNTNAADEDIYVDYIQIDCGESTPTAVTLTSFTSSTSSISTLLVLVVLLGLAGSVALRRKRAA